VKSRPLLNHYMSHGPAAAAVAGRRSAAEMVVESLQQGVKLATEERDERKEKSAHRRSKDRRTCSLRPVETDQRHCRRRGLERCCRPDLEASGRTDLARRSCPSKERQKRMNRLL
jgi:hypothetical protein